MITINLIPEDAKAKEHSIANIKIDFKGHERLLRNIAIAVILVLAVVHTALFLMRAKDAQTLNALSKKYDKLIPSMKEFRALKASLDVTNRKAEAVENLMANRFSWKKKLNELSDSVTQGIWLTSIEYKEVPAEIQVQPKPGSKEEVKKTVSRYIAISGYASSMGEQGTSLIGKFIKSMKDTEPFFVDFSDINLESIKSGKFLEQEVMSFEIKCQFKS